MKKDLYGFTISYTKNYFLSLLCPYFFQVPFDSLHILHQPPYGAGTTAQEESWPMIFDSTLQGFHTQKDPESQQHKQLELVSF